MDSDDVHPTALLVELNRVECLRLLAHNTIGRVVVTIGADAWPVIRPVN